MQPLLDDAARAADPKRARILEGAVKVFLAYGYARTTMDDIARAAEVSRPALYVVFRNKTDIYRAIGATMMARTTTAAEAALAGGGGFAERLTAALDAAFFTTLAPFDESPHGDEILDMKNSLAGDLVTEWRDAMAAVFARAVAEEAARRGTDLAARGLSAAALADLLLDSLEGMKARGLRIAEIGRQARGVVAAVDLALRA
ncbi:TetR/AcrR family transcriptional regulator [Aquibium sp. A9E412]|uniref:helix-turn-helix domain-containing protein n=1 Tax=Aquibium sp. A9E412 TaxID=2976767 RepID=UPI0025AFC8C8|nr:TetR/AcrR family transcriptional regulator [Aquibium sp. A9E412]MDN2566996.1 TetR/AcrR family transcriptional regulator [Aquibium sp. A9E412]